MEQHQAEKHSHYRGHRRREKGAENLFEKIKVENFPNLRKEREIQVQESQSSK